MIQPQWLRRAATVLPPSISTRRLSSKTPTPDTPWPLLKKRTRPSRDDDHIHSGGTALIESLKKRQNPIHAEITPSSDTHDANSGADSRTMLILHGLSTNLNASDFYRLAPSDLSSWQSAIRKVQQQRNPTTLEPLGRYHISFSSSEAAMSYRDRLFRLHKLVRHKLASETGLWKSDVPRHLRSPDGDDPAEELEKFTITSGTHRAVDVDRRRVSGAHKWAQKLGEIAKKFDYGNKPPVVLVHVSPPLTADDLGRYIREDGVSRACEWKVCPPQELQATVVDRDVGKSDDGDGTATEVDVRPQTQREIDIRENIKGRFVVVCANEAEARRFHRHWNQKTLTADPGDTAAMRNIVHASIINW